ncbi:MAG TPA: hypothetical protein VFB72_20730, partial [Verrucomicrobiae bacterium]|nr:hypothetical protein [Verrucomicrobiae bacterium]
DRGPAGIRALMDESQRYGIINGAAGAIAERFSQANIRLRASLNGLGSEIGAVTYPAMTKLVNGMAEAAANVRDMVAHNPELVEMVKAALAASAAIAALSAVSKATSMISGGVGMGFAAVGGVSSLADLVAYIRLLPAIAGAAAAGIAVVAGEVVALAAAIYTVKKYLDMLDAKKQEAEAAGDRATQVMKLNDAVFASLRRLRASGDISAEKQEELLKPLREAAKSGDIDKLQAALTRVAIALREVQGASPEGNKTIWTKDELDRQQKLLGIEEQKIRLEMERHRMEDIPSKNSPAMASTDDWQARLRSLLNQQRAMLDEAHKQGAVSDQEFAERSIKLDEEKLRLEQEIRTSRRSEQSELNAAYDQELQRKQEILAFDRETIQNSFKLNPQEKLAAEKTLLEIEKQLVDEAAKRYEFESRMAALQKDAVAYQDAQRKLSELQKQRSGLDMQGAKMNAQADPNSFSDQFTAVGVKLQNEWGSWAQQTAHSFESVFNSAIQSISKGITGLIEGTMTWGQALRQIGSSILNEIIQAIVQMGVRWVMTQVMMAVAGKTIAASATATLAPIAAAQAAIWAAPATLSTIASYGGAAAAAPGEIAAAQGVVQGLSAFYEGGYTGDGNPNTLAGLVHRGEFVMPADAVRRIGLTNLETMKNSSMSQGAPIAAAQGGGNTHHHVWFDHDALQQYIRSAPWFENHVVSVIGKNMHKLR